MEKAKLFDEWPEKYDQWFTTPIGLLVKKYESELLLNLLRPNSDEFILDAGCGTGVFTLDILSFGTHIIGVDHSLLMLSWAPVKGMVRAAIHFEKEKNPNRAPAVKFEGLKEGLLTGAFVVARWQKPRSCEATK